MDNINFFYRSRYDVSSKERERQSQYFPSCTSPVLYSGARTCQNWEPVSGSSRDSLAYNSAVDLVNSCDFITQVARAYNQAVGNITKVIAASPGFLDSMKIEDVFIISVCFRPAPAFSLSSILFSSCSFDG